MPGINNRRHLKFKSVDHGHDQSMGLAEEQRLTALRIAAAKAAARPVSERLAALAARAAKRGNQPAGMHSQRAAGLVVETPTADRQARAARLRRKAASA